MMQITIILNIKVKMSRGPCREVGYGSRRLKYWCLRTKTRLRKHDGRHTESRRVRDSHGITIIRGVPDKGLHRRGSGQTHGRSDGMNCGMGIRVWEWDTDTTSKELSVSHTPPRSHSKRGRGFSFQAAVLDDVFRHHSVGVVDNKFILTRHVAL